MVLVKCVEIIPNAQIVHRAYIVKKQQQLFFMSSCYYIYRYVQIKAASTKLTEISRFLYLFSSFETIDLICAINIKHHHMFRR